MPVALFHRWRCVLGFTSCVFGAIGSGLFAQEPSPAPVYNIRAFGATGHKTDNARAAIQKAIDVCAAAGGGTVFFPAGNYPSGTLHLRSHVRLFLDAGATLYSVKDKSAFDQEALIFGDGVSDIAVEGPGTIDGQGAYDWRLNDHQDDFIRPNQERMEAAGKPLLRSFPKPDQFGKLFLLLRCKDVRISGVRLINSPSWTIHPYACERLLIDGVYIHTSLEAGVWADGIDPDGCKDVRIANCTIETGDDAIVFYSMNWFGPPLPCENITVTNCRLTSSSSAIKFCDGNMNAVRNVTIDNCVITASNRGIAFMDFDGGLVSDVVLSNLSIECTRHDWFWWGDGDPLHFNVRRRSEITKSIDPKTEPPPGKIRRVLISNVIAHGQGTSLCNGHPESWLEDVTIDRLVLYLTADPTRAYDATSSALKFQYVRNLQLRNVEVHWGQPAASGWAAALAVEDVKGLELVGFRGQPAEGSAAGAAVTMNNVTDATIRDCAPSGRCPEFLRLEGKGCRDILLIGNDLRRANRSWSGSETLPAGTVVESGNLSR